MSVEAVVGSIFIRDQYRYVRLYYITRLILLVVGLLALSLFANLWLSQQPVQYRYLMTQPTGRLLNLVPLDQPNMSDEDVIKWTVDAVTRVHTFDFANYRTQFQDAQRVMTVTGWEWFEAALKNSGNMDSVIKNKFVTTAVPTGPARITGTALVQSGPIKRFQWTVEFPMLVTYRSAQGTTSQDLKIRATILRQPEFVNASGLGIRQLIAQ